MMRNVLTAISALLCFVAQATFAQSSLLVKDADGDPIGVFSYALASATQGFVLLTYDGYFLEILPNGYFMQTNMGPLYYLDSECAGQGYFYADVSQGSLALRGNAIIQLSGQNGKDANPPSFATVSWHPQTVRGETMYGVRYSPDDQCSSTSYPQFVGIAADFVDHSLYNIKQMDDLSWRFKTPFSSTMERSEVVFCSGFENCPQQ